MAHKTISLALALAWILATGAGPAAAALEPVQTHALRVESGKVSFLAIGRPSFLKIRGEGSAPEAMLKIEQVKKNSTLSGTAKLTVDSFDTGIKKRNEHMKEKYLETAKYPQAEFTLNPITLPQGFFNREYSEKLPFQGTLKLHGVEKPIQSTVEIKKSGETLQASTTFQILLQDYAIDLPSFAGITVANEVDVTVEFSGVLNATTKPIEP